MRVFKNPANKSSKTVSEAIGGSGRKFLSFTILSLLLFPFQASVELSQQALAGQKLPVLETETGKRASLMVEQSMRAYGYTPWAIREADFRFNITPQNSKYVLVPLGQPITEDTLDMLGRYVSGGGQLILVPAGVTLDKSAERLLQMVGLTVNGSSFVTSDMDLYWKGRALPGEDALPSGSRILTIVQNGKTEVLATWGADYPAVVKTGKGALLNWQWGRQLSDVTNTVALSKVAPLAIDATVASRQITSPAPGQTVYTAPKALETSALGATIIRGGNQAERTTTALIQEQPKTPPAAMTATMPVSSDVVKTATQEQVAPAGIPGGSVEPLSPVFTPMGKMPQSMLYPAPELKEIMSAMSRPERIAQATPAPAAEGAPTDADDEVIQNILGTPQQEQPKPADPTLQDKIDSTGESQPQQKPGGGRGEQGQKHFSFLDAGASEVLAPEFDYGVYSVNMRVLDEYKHRIIDALESAKQLSITLPEEKVRELMKESDQHKRQFEALYLGGKTQQGLDEFGVARRNILQALALTSTSPKVEGRAIWLDRGTIVDSGGPAGVKKLMQKLHKAGINVVYFETMNAGFPIYPSKILKNNPLINNWDPLKAAVEEGHKLGMEVHAWVWVFAVGNKRHNPLIGMAPDYAGPVLVEGGMMDEALRNREGGLSVGGRQNEYWLSPASPKAREFLLSVYKEIVTGYDVDGLHLDYIRYPFQTSYNRMGYERVGRERFARSTGASLDGIDDYTAKIWIAWKTYQVNSFVQETSETMRRLKPDIKISAAVFPMKRDARIVAIQQDWETWVDNGWVDVLNPMSYTTDPERMQRLFQYVQTSPNRRTLVYPGVAINRMDGGRLVLQLEALRQSGGLGATLFAGAHLDAEKVEALGTGPFKEANSLPPHRDILKSVQTYLADYEEKFSKLRADGNLSDSPAAQVAAVQDALSQLKATLASTPAKVEQITPQRLQLVRQQFMNLQAASSAWTGMDKVAHPFRAQYFSKNILLLSELFDYMNDRAVIAAKGAAPATAFQAPPASVPTAEIPAASTGVTAQNASSDEDAKDMEDMPIPN